MFDTGNYWSNPVVEVTTDLLPVKRGDPGRPIISISIGLVDFLEALCDFGSSVNIMPRVLYETLCQDSKSIYQFATPSETDLLPWESS